MANRFAPVAWRLPNVSFGVNHMLHLKGYMRSVDTPLELLYTSSTRTPLRVAVDFANGTLRLGPTLGRQISSPFNGEKAIDLRVLLSEDRFVLFDGRKPVAELTYQAAWKDTWLGEAPRQAIEVSWKT